jgi:hypothetical protein
MSCDLSQYGQYELSTINHDGATGKYIVQIKNPPAKCPEGQFISKNAELRIDGNLTTGLLKYDTAARRPVILAPSQGFVQEIVTSNSSSGLGFFGTVLLLAAIAGVGYIFYRLLSKPKTEDRDSSSGIANPSLREEATEEYVRPASLSPTSSVPTTPMQPNTYVPSQHTTVVVDRGSNDDLLTGVVLGSMLNNQPREVIREVIERERVVERPAPAFSGDDEDDSSTSSDSDSGSSFSSDDDSSSSFSSDDSSSSSFSSDDSSSSFSSDDSSSSFSSDS